MSDDTELDELIDESPAQAREWFRRQVRTHGLRVAYKTAVAVCEDPKAAAPAKATAAGLLLRAAGVLTKTEETDEIPIEQMSMEQMQAEFARLEAEALERQRELDELELLAETAPRAKPSVFD